MHTIEFYTSMCKCLLVYGLIHSSLPYKQRTNLYTNKRSSIKATSNNKSRAIEAAAKCRMFTTRSLPTSIPGPSRWDGDEDPGKIRFIVPKFWERNRMRSETQPYSTVLQYGCVALRMWLFSQNFGTIKWILPGSSSPSHREGPGTEVAAIYVSYIYVLYQKALGSRLVLSSWVVLSSSHWSLDYVIKLTTSRAWMSIFDDYT